MTPPRSNSRASGRTSSGTDVPVEADDGELADLTPDVAE